MAALQRPALRVPGPGAGRGAAVGSTRSRPGTGPVPLLQALRPRQWTKNLFVFAGLVFSQHLLDPVAVGRVALAFLVFCLVSGVVYLVNDLKDLDQDRHHPLKSRRPLASGRLSPRAAWAAMAVLLPVSLAVAGALGVPFLTVTVAYVAVQVLYTWALKRVVILDVFSIAAGFVLRVVAGAVVIHVAISHWLLLCTTLLALFLGLAKRRHELTLAGENAALAREVLSEYSPYLLDQLISVVTAATLVSYTLYTTAPETVEKFGTRNLFYTVPFVLYGIFRYLYLIHMKGAGAEGAGGAPENTLLTDRPLLVNLFLWALVVAVVLYAPR